MLIYIFGIYRLRYIISSHSFPVFAIVIYCDEFLLDSFIVLGNADLAFSRFYDPQEGLILVGGRDLKHLDVSWWRKQIGLVSQQPMLFDMTLEERFRGGSFRCLKYPRVRSSKPSERWMFSFFLWGGGAVVGGTTEAQFLIRILRHYC